MYLHSPFWPSSQPEVPLRTCVGVVSLLCLQPRRSLVKSSGHSKISGTSSDKRPVQVAVSAQPPMHPAARPTQGRRKLKLSKSHPRPFASSTPPAPPPTSPLCHTSPRQRHPSRRSVTPLETAILGAESDSLKVHYSVHVNLQKLQRGVRDVGGASPEGEWPSQDGHAHRPLRAARRKKSSPSAQLEAGAGESHVSYTHGCCV